MILLCCYAVMLNITDLFEVYKTDLADVADHTRVPLKYLSHVFKILICSVVMLQITGLFQKSLSKCVVDKLR